MNNFSKYLENFMRERELKLEYIAELTEVSFSLIGHYRKGIRSPSYKFLNKFFKAFNICGEERERITRMVELDKMPPDMRDINKKDFNSKKENHEEYYIPFFSNIKVAAGRGKLNWDYSTTKFKIGEKFSKAGYVACTVEGDSMVPDIVEGDILILDTKEPSNVNGKIFVVNYNGEVYLKEIYIEGDAVVLHSKNGSYKPIIVTDKSKLHIVGKVMAIYREY
ncbi:MAG: XRE family transcriptional regulator [Cetobacterium sp.]